MMSEASVLYVTRCESQALLNCRSRGCLIVNSTLPVVESIPGHYASLRATHRRKHWPERAFSHHFNS